MSQTEAFAFANFLMFGPDFEAETWSKFEIEVCFVCIHTRAVESESLKVRESLKIGKNRI